MKRKNEDHYINIIEFANNYYSDYGRSPSTREIEKGIGVPRSTIQRYLKDLKETGIIEYDGHRNIVTEFIREGYKQKFNRIPIAGSIPCSDFNDAVQLELEHYFLPKALTGNGEFFLLVASGESMIDAGIDDGDLVLIKEQNTVESGQIAAFLYESDQATLKRYYNKDNCVILHPENQQMNDIVITGNKRKDLYVQGVATMVIKKLK